MGGAVSAGVDNDDIIDKLKGADYINTVLVEKAFRLVDRGNYILREDRKAYAYKDAAWRRGNLHISAPCIYAQALEGLQIQRGMSFLNLGSGTGYLSTIAGLLIGTYGINHGIEIHSDVISYARSRLDEFIMTSGAIDVMDFCKPQYIQGNAFNVSDSGETYDRIYCGAACNSNCDFVKNLLKVGGILVIPAEDQLMRMQRISQTEFISKSLLPVTFSTLIPPESENQLRSVVLPSVEIVPLQELCRLEIRKCLRISVEKEHENLRDAFNRNVKSSPRDSGTFENNSSSDEGEVSESDNQDHRQTFNTILELTQSFTLDRMNHRTNSRNRESGGGRQRSRGRDEQSSSSIRPNEDDENFESKEENISGPSIEVSNGNDKKINLYDEVDRNIPETFTDEFSTNLKDFSKILNNKNVSQDLTDKNEDISNNFTDKNGGNFNDKTEDISNNLTDENIYVPQNLTDKNEDISNNLTDENIYVPNNLTDKNEDISNNLTDKIEDALNNLADKNEDVLQNLTDKNESVSNNLTDKNEEVSSKSSHKNGSVSSRENLNRETFAIPELKIPTTPPTNVPSDDEEMICDNNVKDLKPDSTKRGHSESSTGDELQDSRGTNASQPKNHKLMRREKFDSGLGDDIDMDTSSDSDSDSSDGEFNLNDTVKFDDLILGYLCRGPYNFSRRRGSNSRRDRVEESTQASMSYPVSEYVNHMRDKISRLPIPTPLKMYINYNRDL